MNIKTVNPNYFVVKIKKQQQKETKQGTGTIKRAETFTFGKGGVQCGEVVAIGKFASWVIPQAKVGGFLIFSWRVEYVGDDSEKPNMALIHEDEIYNYYTVTISEYKGKDTETYAYFDKSVFVTHPSFVILEKRVEKENVQTTTKSGLIIFDNYQMSDSEIQQKIDFNTQWIYSLSITHSSQSQTRESSARETRELITKLEQENKNLSIQLHKTERFLPYKVAYFNPSHQTELKKGSDVYGWNIFCLQPIFLDNKEYIIAPYKQMGAVPV